MPDEAGRQAGAFLKGEGSATKKIFMKRRCPSWHRGCVSGIRGIRNSLLSLFDNQGGMD
jgi:hypothetical protein